MSNEMPKHSEPENSLKDLAKNSTRLEEIKHANEISGENVKRVEHEKLLDDTEALRDNARIVNNLGKFLVWLFFGKFKRIYFVFLWVIAYVCLNIYFYECLGEKGQFYSFLIDKIGLFLIVCILGKFLKDSISNIIEIFKK